MGTECKVNCGPKDHGLVIHSKLNYVVPVKYIVINYRVNGTIQMEGD